ncbi:MAG: hypothetical protein BGO01_17060 [Armatimonadetes bacterium 55-13]|nr:glycoside hydrolase family 127 protein [Armatimonadota bacterium]OJU63866.1 MAG: hypothetical protein BGO01_17060 [Armatimonadetes bacterium 55-13]
MILPALIAAFAVALPHSNLEKPTLKAQPFSLTDVRLEGGPYLESNKACVAYLLTVSPDRLLHNFREHAGLKPKGEKYGGWEDSGLAGHSLGHYLTACSQEFASGGDKRFKEKVDYIVTELAECQKARPDGCISAIPGGDKVWEELRKGDIRSRGFDLNGLWSPWYTHHKVLAGLLDAYHLTGNKKAITVAEKFADWAIDLTKDLTDEQWQKMLGTEYGGMNDSLAELYAVTGKQKYLDLSRKFYDRVVLDPLAEGKDSLPGKHSNTQIPKIIGLSRLYELTGDPRDRKIAEFFWDRVVHHHTYVIGGNSNHEYLGAPDQLNDRLSSNTCETCNTYNMLKLTRHLFEWSPNAEYADFYERAHINHILGSQDPSTGMMCYFVPLASGSHRNHSNPEFDWTCCHGSGMENHTKHADSIYFHSGGDKLYLNLYIPSELNWKDAGIKLKQTTEFPKNGAVKLTIEQASKSGDRELLIRHPYWALSAVEVKVNGKTVATSDKPTSYISVKRAWKKGDVVEFNLPMSLRTESMPDNPKRVAIMYGPLVMTADLGAPQGEMPRTPVLVTNDKPVADWVKPDGTALEFKTKEAGRPGDLTLRPFYTFHKDRYAVYFDKFTDAEWQTAEAEYRAEEARQEDLKARTFDYMRIGEMQPERDHNLKAEKTDVREANGRGFRTPMNEGWIEFEMKVEADAPTDLILTYWGNERTRPEFDILIDGKKIATENLSGQPANKFYDVTYPVPTELTQGKQKITVRIQSTPNHWSGSISGARTVKQK